MKKPWTIVAILVFAYPFISVGIKMLLTESIVASGVYGLILVGLIIGIMLAFRHKPTPPVNPTKPAWEESLNKRA
jgi:hypothetical protein